MTPNSIDFYSGIYVTIMCDMVTVGLKASEKTQGQTYKQTNKQTNAGEKTTATITRGPLGKGESHTGQSTL